MKDKKRLDVFLFEKKYFSSREKARREIMAGNVFVDSIRQDKPGFQIKEDQKIDIKKKSLIYVGRGGLKLEKAAEEWSIDFKDKVVVDIGASTGGFTDFVLRNGARIVYAIDVGYGQLDFTLRNNEKVINMERTNIRYLFKEKDDNINSSDNQDNEITKNIDLLHISDIVLIDVSFISLNLVFPTAKKLLKENGMIIALIKPQFEAEKNQVGRGGIIKDENIHSEVLENVKGYAKANNLIIEDIIESPIKGAKGNTEFLGKISRI